MKLPSPRIIEIDIHRSRKNPKLGYAVALLFTCNHHKYLGVTVYKGDDNTNVYKVSNCRVIRFEDYDVMDKEVCKLCPSNDMWLEDMPRITDPVFTEFVQAIDEL